MSDHHESANNLGREPKVESPAAPGSISPDKTPIEKFKEHGDKKVGSSRGIETLFRVTYQNHIQLSQLADGKANTLISINGVIISIVIALVAPQLGSLAEVVAPSLTLLVGCTVSLTFAVIASRPRLNKHSGSPDEHRAEDINLLFFGEFLNMSAEQYAASMRELMQDRQQVYDKMIQEIYSMGRVLEKKYQRLQLAYTSFLATLILAVGLFVIAFLQHVNGA
jgi:hypothetical protein